MENFASVIRLNMPLAWIIALGPHMQLLLFFILLKDAL